MNFLNITKPGDITDHLGRQESGYRQLSRLGDGADVALRPHVTKSQLNAVADALNICGNAEVDLRSRSRTCVIHLIPRTKRLGSDVVPGQRTSKILAETAGKGSILTRTVLISLCEDGTSVADPQSMRSATGDRTMQITWITWRIPICQSTAKNFARRMNHDWSTARPMPLLGAVRGGNPRC